MRRPVRLWLVRHARPLVVDGVCYGASDVPACADDTAAAALRLSQQLPAGAEVRVSGLGRAQQLAAALHGLRPDLGPAVVDTDLNEMDFGHWELQRWAAIERSQLDAWAADFAHYRPGGRENVVQLLERVRRSLRSLVEGAPDDGAPCAIWITHAGVIRAVQYLGSGGAGQAPSAATWPHAAPTFGGAIALDWDGCV